MDRHAIQKKESYLFKGLKNYADCSTVHGISYVFDPQTSLVERGIWLVLVCTSACVAVHMVEKSYTNWQDNQVITTLKTVAKGSLKKSKFP